MQYSLLLPELILAGLGLLLLGLDLTATSKRALAVAGVIGTLATLAAVIANFGVTATDIWSGTIRVDDFAQYFKLIFLVILGLIFLFSNDYLEKRQVKIGEFYILVTFATLGAFLMVSSLELITIYLGLELLTIASYILAGMLRHDTRSSEASIKFFLMGALTSGVILYGFSLLYGLTGSTHLVAIAEALAGSSNNASDHGGGGLRHRGPRFQDRGGALPYVGARHVRRRSHTGLCFLDHRIGSGGLWRPPEDSPRGTCPCL